MASTSTSTADFIYKNQYGKLVESEQRKHPTLDAMKKEGGLGGRTYNYDVSYGDGQGGAWGSSFSTAQTNVSPIKGVQFAMSPKNGWRVTQIDGVSLQLSMPDDGAFENLVVKEMKGSLNGLMNDLGLFLFGDGGGARGRRSGALSSNTVTLYNRSQARNFFIGMTVKAGVSTSSLRSGSTTVTGVDTDAGTITLANAASISGFLADDYLFREGETGNVVPEGLASIIPLTAPVLSSDSFRTVDRGVYPSILAGSRLSADGSTPEELALRVATKIFDAGGDSDTLIMSPLNAQALCNRGSSRIIVPNGEATFTYGFTGAFLQSPAGRLKLVSEPDCPADRGYVGRMKDLRAKYAGPSFIHSAYDDAKFSGKFFFPKDASDAIEGRSRVITNYIIDEPRNWGVFEVA